MKLVLLIPSLQPGGMERVMSSLFQNFAGLNETIDLHLILYGMKRNVSYDIPRSVNRIHDFLRGGQFSLQ